MSHLLDTHILLWLLGDPARVPAGIQRTLAEPSTSLFVSAASALEIATKVRLGKLDVGRPLVDGWTSRLAEIGASELPVTAQHARLAGGMTWAHRDPFDRLLVAQATIENVVLVTTDAVMLDVPGLRVLTW